MIGITNPPGRFILQVAHDVVFVDLFSARTQSLQAARVCLMPTKFRGLLAFLQSKKSLYGFVAEAFYEEAPMCDRN